MPQRKLSITIKNHLQKRKNQDYPGKLKKKTKKDDNKKMIDQGQLQKKVDEKIAKESKDSSESKKSIFELKITSKDVDENEETVDLDTKEFKYISYFIKIKRKIEMVWSYPRDSYLKGHTGKVRVLMSLNRDGKLIDVNIIDYQGMSYSIMKQRFDN